MRESSVGPARFAAELFDASAGLADTGALRRWVLQRLGESLPYDSAIFIVRPEMSSPPASVNKEEFLHLHRRLATDRDRLAPGLAKGRRAMLVEGAYLDTEVYTAGERCNLPFYAEFIRPQRITNQLIARVSFRERDLGIIFLCRNGSVAPFRPRDREALKLLSPAIGLVNAALAQIRVPTNEQMTAREIQIAQLVARGLQTPEVAALLGTSPNTVRNQLSQIFDKLGVANRTELAVWATQHLPED